MKHMNKDKKVQKQFADFEKQLNKEKSKNEKKKKAKNVGKYMKMISNRHLINDVKFFKESLSLKEQTAML